MKKLFLTSMLVLGGGAALAEPSNTQNTFPVDGFMQADYAYVGQANSDNMAGVYQNDATVYANAQYEDTQYTIDPGYYLPGSSETQTQCNQDGYFCPGNMTVYYSANPQGLSQCPDGFEHSDAGASSDTQCYTACANDYFPHSSSTIGNDYYGAGTDTCELTGCVNGYTFVPSTPDLANIIGSTTGTERAYMNNNGFNEWHDNPGHGQAYYGISGEMSFAVEYAGIGMLTGVAQCSGTAGENDAYTTASPSVYNSLPEGNGQNCWCSVDGFTPNGETKQNVHSGWVFHSTIGSYASCPDVCANTCSNYLMSDNSVRSALFDSIVPSAASCQANTINITWNGTDSTAINQNNAGTCQYDGDINTPAWATHVPGKTFLGWQFSTTAPQD